MRSAIKAKAVITDHEIETLVLVREEYRHLKAQMETAKDSLDALEAEVIAQIDSGTIVASRCYRLDIQEIARRYPAWKEHYVEIAGKDAADRVLDTTEPKLYRNLVIKSA